LPASKLEAQFRRDLKTLHFAGHWRHERITGVTVSRNRAIQIDIDFTLLYFTLLTDNITN